MILYSPSRNFIVCRHHHLDLVRQEATSLLFVPQRYAQSKHIIILLLYITHDFRCAEIILPFAQIVVTFHYRMTRLCLQRKDYIEQHRGIDFLQAARWNQGWMPDKANVVHF